MTKEIYSLIWSVSVSYKHHWARVMILWVFEPNTCMERIFSCFLKVANKKLLVFSNMIKLKYHFRHRIKLT